MAASRLNPTLFDKLTADLEMEGLRETDTAELRAAAEMNRASLRFYHVPRLERFNDAALRMTVRRELNWLMNTTNLDAVVDLAPYPQVKTSVANYGVPDLTGKTLNQAVIVQRAKDIKAAIRIFEPRMDPDRLSVEPGQLGERENSVTFVINGDITNAVQAMPVSFRTDVEIDTGAATVRE